MKPRTFLLLCLVVLAIVSFTLFAPVIPVHVVNNTGIDTSVVISWSSVTYYVFGFGEVSVHHCADACIISTWSYEFRTSPTPPPMLHI